MVSHQRITLEVCVASVQDALAAAEGGADRLELNNALELGGLTPSTGLVLEVLQAVRLPVIVMVRPRGAGFSYQRSERLVMMRDAECLLGLGIAGIAFGMLTADHRIDHDACAELIRLAGDRQTVFHRAIDAVADIESAVCQLADLGVTRVLTSGQAATAWQGAETIAQMHGWSRGQLEVLPAAGVNQANVQSLLQRTRCDQVHGSFSRLCRDDAGPVAPSTYRTTEAELVASVRRVLDRLE